MMKCLEMTLPRLHKARDFEAYPLRSVRHYMACTSYATCLNCDTCCLIDDTTSRTSCPQVNTLFGLALKMAPHSQPDNSSTREQHEVYKFDPSFSAQQRIDATWRSSEVTPLIRAGGRPRSCRRRNASPLAPNAEPLSMKSTSQMLRK